MQHQRAFPKHILFPGLIANTTVALALLFTSDEQRTNAGPVYRSVGGNRAATQIIVQITAQMLGALLTFSVTSLVNYYTRERLMTEPTSLERLRLWQSICFVSPDWSLSFSHLLVSLSFLCVLFVPSALWTGALTPLASTKQVHTAVAIPAYDPDYGHRYWNRTYIGKTIYNTFTSDTGKGTFSYNPSSRLAGSIVDVAAFATVTKVSDRMHTKLDTSRYSYRGRSYGVGSSIGLVDLARQDPQSIRQYTFLEAGYKATASCTRNESSQWLIRPANASCPSWYNIYPVSGLLPNSKPDKVENTLCLDVAIKHPDSCPWQAAWLITELSWQLLLARSVGPIQFWTWSSAMRISGLHNLAFLSTPLVSRSTSR